MRKRRWVLVGLVLVGMLVVLGVGLFVDARAARRSLAEGRQALADGRDLLADGDAAQAAAAFGRAGDRFQEAVEETEGLWFRLAGVVPIVGRSPEAVHAIAEAGVRVSGAGSTLAAALEDVGGISALAPSRGRIPIEPIRELAPSVEHAEAEVAGALSTLERAPQSLLIGAIGPARREAEEQLRSLHDLLGTASSLLDGLPSFLGAGEPRRYLFGAQNPAELRGTGGIIGAYSILTIDDGTLELSPFEPIQSLPMLSVDDAPPPSDEYARNYDQFRGEGRFWLAINVTPDFPTAAAVLVDAYEAARGERLDGVVLADPLALAALMRLTGPATVPGLGVTLNANDVVAFTANAAYAFLPDNEARKRLLGEVAETVVDRFLAGGDLDAGDVRALARVAGQGHLLLYSVDPAFQAGLEQTGAGGALAADDGEDLLAVIENSSGGNKVDYYEDRAVRYEIWLQPDGSARATATVALTNHAPTSGQPKYVIGPYQDYSLAGESAQIVSVFCGSGCRLMRAERDGEKIGVGTGSELGFPYFRDDFRTPSGGRSELQIAWYLPEAWEGGSTGGAYRLVLLDQPSIRPDTTTVVVHLPEGMRASETDPAMQVEDAMITWDGTLEGRLELEVRFQPPPLMRWWRLLTPA
jgi:hypothetical protein